MPVTAAVNVGTDKILSSWLHQTGLLPIYREDIDLPAGHTLLSLIGSLTNSGWGGCVTARVGPQGYDLTDAPPDPLVGETLFVPYFAPDEPSSGNGLAFPESGYTNDYINDMLIPGTLVARRRNGEKYLGAAVLSPGYGPNYNCVAALILPLTNVKGTINSAIDAIAADCNTVIPEGLAWGWRVLSQGPPFTEGAPHDDQTTIKIVVLLTAAANSISGTSGQNHSDFSAYGFAASGWLGATGSQRRRLLDASYHSYTHLYHRLPGRDGAGRTILQNCAPPPTESLGNQRYFESPTVAALQGVFANIALGLNQLRLANLNSVSNDFARVSDPFRILHVLRGSFRFSRALDPELDHRNARCGFSFFCRVLPRARNRPLALPHCLGRSGVRHSLLCGQLDRGGDVKLMTGAALWAGPQHIAIFLLAMSALGFLIAIVLLGLRDLRHSITGYCLTTRS